MIISQRDNWFHPHMEIDDYMNLFYYSGDDERYWEIHFGYQNMFITLEIYNKMFREDY